MEHSIQRMLPIAQIERNRLMATEVKMYRDKAGELHNDRLSADVGDARYTVEEVLINRDWKDIEAKEIVGFLLSNRPIVQDLYRAIDKKARAEVKANV